MIVSTWLMLWVLFCPVLSCVLSCPVCIICPFMSYLSCALFCPACVLFCPLCIICPFLSLCVLHPFLSCVYLINLPCTIPPRSRSFILVLHVHFPVLLYFFILSFHLSPSTYIRYILYPVNLVFFLRDWNGKNKWETDTNQQIKTFLVKCNFLGTTTNSFIVISITCFRALYISHLVLFLLLYLSLVQSDFNHFLCTFCLFLFWFPAMFCCLLTL